MNLDDKGIDKDDDRDKGFVLVSVLLMLTMLGLLAGLALTQSRSAVRLATDTRARFEAEIFAEAALYNTIYDLQSPKNTFHIETEPITRSLFEAEYTMSIQPMSGRIDLNRAPEQMLSALFTTAGLDDQTARELAAAIADWRDPDEAQRTNGAELAAYTTAGRDYGPQNDPFESVTEVNWVLGMTPELYNCIAHALTVHSGQPGVDLTYAPNLVKQALDDQGKEKLPNRKAEQTTNPGPATNKKLSILDGDVIEITITAPLRNEQTYTLTSAVRLTSNPGNPFWILDWNPKIPRELDENNCKHKSSDQ